MMSFGRCCAGQVAHLVHVDALGLLGDPVGHDVVEAPREVHRAPGGEMPAVRQVRAQHRVPRLEQGEVDRHVGLGSRMRLHVHVLRPEELLGAGDRQVLGDVHDLAPAVVALARVALGVLVRHHRAHRLQHRLGDEVLGRDQLEVARLPLGLGPDGLGDLRIHLLEMAHGRPSGWRRSMSAIFSTRRACRPPAKSVSSHAWRMSAAMSGAHQAAAQHEHVGVVVLAAHPRGVEIPAEGGADARHLVGGDAHADPGAADQEAALDLVIGHGFAHQGRVVGVVHRLRGVGAEVEHLEAVIYEPALEGFL